MTLLVMAVFGVQLGMRAATSDVVFDFTDSGFIQNDLGITLPNANSATYISEPVTYQGVTMTTYKSTNYPGIFLNQAGTEYSFRIYKIKDGNKGAAEFSVEKGSITKIVMEGDTKMKQLVANVGTITMSNSDKTLTWEGEATSVKFENDNTSNTVRINKLTVTTTTADYYLIGSMTNWAVDEGYKLTLNEEADAEEYMITKDLTKNTEFKVVKAVGTDIKTWYPDGANYTITEDGNYSVYFRPDGNSAWDNNYFYVAKNPTEPTTWTVAGDSETLFGTAWDPAKTSNDLEDKGDGQWEKLYDNVQLTAGTIEYKIVGNHNWGIAYPEQNAKLEIEYDGEYNVSFWFNSTTKSVEAYAKAINQQYSVTFVNTRDWDKVYAYTWKGDGENAKAYSAAWPGDELTKTGEKDGHDVYTYTFEKPSAPTKIIFNNGENPGEEGSTKTADLDFTDGKQYTGPAPEEPVVLNTYTATFVNTDKWATVYAYTFNDETLGGWPGTQLEKSGTKTIYDVEYDVYAVTIKAETMPTKIIFNNGNSGDGNQTGDLDFVDGTEYMGITTPTEPVEPVTEDTWTVAGAPETVFGSSWTVSDENNDMVKQQDGTYKWEKSNLTLPEGAVYFKVAKNHDWSEAYPSDNYSLSIPTDGIYTITITFNPDTKAVNATATKTSDAAIEPTYVIAGNLEDLFGETWNGTAEANKMEKQDDGTYKKAYTGITMPTEFSELKYKIVKNGADWLGTENGDGDGNYVVNVIAGATYNFTFTFNAETKKAECEATKTADPVVEKQTYTATFTTNAGWEKVHAYVYNDGGDIDNVVWPGKEITETLADGKYTYTAELTAAPTHIIFNNGNSGEGNQTDDLAFVDGKEYSYEVTETPVETPETYAIVGELTGGWNDDATTPDAAVMTKGEDGLYTYVLESFTAEEKAYQYKLRANNKWGVFDLPSEGNQEYTFTEAGNYKLTFTANVTGEAIGNVDAYTLTLDAEKIETPEEDATINTVEFYAWGPGGTPEWAKVTMTKGEGDTWTGFLDLSEHAGDADFKLVINGGGDESDGWKGWIGTNKMTVIAPDEWVVATGESDNQNCTINHSQTGYLTYNITATWTPNPDYAAGWTLKVEGKDERTEPIVEPTLTGIEIRGGKDSSWSEQFTWTLTANDDNTAYVLADQAVEPNWEFKVVATYSDNTVKWLSPASDGMFLVTENLLGTAIELNTDNNPNMYFDKAGTFNFTVAGDLSTLTITGEFNEQPIDPVGEDHTVTFVNGGDWEEVYAYTWTDDVDVNGDGVIDENDKVEQLGAWPGTKMLIATNEAKANGVVMKADGDEHDLYTITITSTVAPKNIIFNNGKDGDEAQKTADLTFTDDKEYSYDETPEEPTLTGVEIRGGKDSQWSEQFTWNLTLNDAGTAYVTEQAVEAGWEFKVVATYSNGDVKWFAPASDDGMFLVTEELLGQELAIAETNPRNMYVDREGTLTFTVNSDLSTLTITGEFTSEPVEHIYTIAGQAALMGSEWKEDDTNNDMTLGDDGHTWTLTKTNLTLDAGNYEYKVTEDHSWAVNYGQDGVQDGANMVITIGEKAIYTVVFTFDSQTKLLSAEATKTSEIPTAITMLQAAIDNGEAVVYDLRGNRVRTAHRGIFIVNGVKQAVK